MNGASPESPPAKKDRPAAPIARYNTELVTQSLIPNVAAPSSTFDLTIESGNQIPIEQRDASEIKNLFGKRTAPDGIDVYNPAFDVTPAELIAAIITERGVIQPVSRAAIAQHLRAI